MTQVLMTRDAIELALDPRRTIAQAEDAAVALMDVVAKQHLYLELKGARHLYIEAWELLGFFYGLSAGIADLNDVRDIYDTSGQWIGAEAYATLFAKEGHKIGGATALCLSAEPGREEMARFQVRSMAQTRASSKAYRLKLAFVAVLAGFSGTPAEEMTQAEQQARMEMPRCPTHPRRNPREWARAGQPLWKCTAKVGNGYCDWTAPRGKEALRQDAPPETIAVDSDTGEISDGPITAPVIPLGSELVDYIAAFQGANSAHELQGYWNEVPRELKTQEPSKTQLMAAFSERRAALGTE